MDAQLERDTDVRFETVTLDDMLAVTSGAALRMVILDACRNNPLARSMQRTGASRSLSRGSFGDLDESMLGDETLVAYAAAAGTTAADGTGRNSPYTAALLEHLEEPLEILTLFRRVRAGVLASTNGEQRPHEYQSLLGEHYLASNGGTLLGARRAPRDPPSRRDPRMVEAALDLDRAVRRRIQQRLASAGFSPGPADGVFGPATRAAIWGWQTALGTAVTGYLDAAGAEVLASGVAAAGTTVTVAAPAPVVGDVADADLADLDPAQLRRIAEQGEAAAQTELGARYETGRGVTRDYEEAVRWYRRAVDQGHARGQASLGAAHSNGTGVPHDDEAAVPWFRRAAEQGDARGQNGLGFMYANGWGVREDHAEAVRWFRLAADQGDADAQRNLGAMYANGWGVREDHAEAARWYRLAADQGNAIAQRYLGFMYANGEGVREDHAEAVRWYRLAADQGYATAQYNLGFMYENGRGVRQDRAEALRYSFSASKPWT